MICIPSRHEPLGNAVLEGLAAGKPVVATSTTGPSWILRDGADGILVKPDDAASLAAAIARLQFDEPLARRLVAEGLRTLSSRFGEDAVCDAYLRLFDRG